MTLCYFSDYTLYICLVFFFFFFQAEDGIRDVAVTGVQTCALPIFSPPLFSKPYPAPVSTLGHSAVRPGGAVPAEHARCLTSAGLGELIPRARTGKNGVLAGGNRGHGWGASPRNDRRGNSGECQDCDES